MYPIVFLAFGLVFVSCQDADELTFLTKFPDARFDCDPKQESCDFVTDGWIVEKSTADFTGSIDFPLTLDAFSLQRLTTKMDVKFDLYMTDLMAHEDVFRDIDKEKDMPQASYEYAASREVRLMLLPLNRTIRKQHYFYVLELHTNNEPESNVLQCQPGINYTVRSFVDVDNEEFSVNCAVIYTFNINKFFLNMTFEITDTMIKIWEQRYTPAEAFVLNLYIPGGLDVKYFSLSSRFPGIKVLINTTETVNTTVITSPPFLITTMTVCHKEIFTVTALKKNEGISVTMVLSNGISLDLDKIKPTALGEQVSEQEISAKTDSEVRLKLTASPHVKITSVRHCMGAGTSIEPSMDTEEPMSTTPSAASLEDDGEMRIHNLILMNKESFSASLYWPVPEASKDKPASYRVVYNCLRVLACNMSCPNFSEEVEINAPHIVLTQLLPYSRYAVSVSANGGPPITRYLETKMADPPTETPLLSNKPIVKTDKTLTVFWESVTVCSGIFKQYVYHVFETDNNTHSLLEGCTNETHITFDIDPLNDYTVNAYVETLTGYDKESYLQINVSAAGIVKSATFTNLHIKKSISSKLTAPSYLFCMTLFIILTTWTSSTK